MAENQSVYKSEVLAWQIIEKPVACVKRHEPPVFIIRNSIF